MQLQIFDRSKVSCECKKYKIVGTYEGLTFIRCLDCGVKKTKKNVKFKKYR